MSRNGTITIEGKIVDVKDGQKRMSRSYTFGYRVLRVLVGFEYFSVLVNTSKLNDFGFLPKTGQWVRMKGRLSPPKEGYFDPSIKWVTELLHIEAPKKK